MTTTNKKIISIISIVLVLSTVLCCTLVGCSAKEVPSSNPTETNLDNDFAVETNNTEYVKLAMGVTYAAAETNSVNKTITATVLPATAINKAVDWSVEWADNTNTSNVGEYITVTPDSDGSTTATVSCYKAFSGNILITVTTRESNYTASCVVTFIGLPTDISATGSLMPYGENNTCDLGIGQTYTYSIKATNIFNSVGSAYNNITCTLSGVGSIVLGGYDTAFGWYESSIKTVTLDSLKDNFINASYSNGTLTITTVKSIESYYASMKRADGGRTKIYEDKFKEYVDDCYFIVVLHEQTSGLRKTLTIRFDDSIVTGVNSNVSEMTF